jgi:hypothetical protein
MVEIQTMIGWFWVRHEIRNLWLAWVRHEIRNL